MKKDPPKYKIRDHVLLKNCKTQTYGTKYLPNFCICKVIDHRPYNLKDPTGHVGWVSLADIPLLMPAEYVVSMFPEIKHLEGHASS